MRAGSDSGIADAVLELVADVVGLLDVREFRAGLLDALERVVRVDFVSLNDIGPRPHDVHVIVRPPLSDEWIDTFRRLAHENPLIADYQRTGQGCALRFSDVIDRDEFHRTAIYRELYRHLGVEYQMAFTLPAPPRRLLGVALSRGAHDFSDAERAMINRARPLLIQAYRNAIEHSALSTRESLATMSDPAVLIAALVSRRLTAREAEVMAATAAGRPTTAVAERLAISPRTVQKHLERSYRKLGVSNRSEAAALVAELGDPA